MSASVIQINTKPKSLDNVGLPKIPVGQVHVKREGLEGDHNHYRMKKGNHPDKAVMVISTDILDQLNQEGWPVKPGDLGENFLITNINYSEIAIGQQYAIGKAKIEISLICDPCIKLYKLPYVGNERGKEFMKTILKRRGWYARVLKEGLVSIGDTISLLNS